MLCETAWKSNYLLPGCWQILQSSLECSEDAAEWRTYDLCGRLRRYDCSGHFLWCGERTRQLDAAHVEFMRGIANPIGVKVSDKMDGSQLVSLIAALNPENTPGRLAVIIRMGAGKVGPTFSDLDAAVPRDARVRRRQS